MQYITSLLPSTPRPPATTSPLKVRVEYSCGSVEYTTTCSTVVPGGGTAGVMRKSKVVREASGCKPLTAPWACIRSCGHRCQKARLAISEEIGKNNCLVPEGWNDIRTPRELVGTGIHSSPTHPHGQGKESKGDDCKDDDYEGDNPA